MKMSVNSLLSLCRVRVFRDGCRGGPLAGGKDMSRICKGYVILAGGKDM